MLFRSGFLELRRPWGFSPEARRGSQGASRAVPGKSGLHARGEGEHVMALESREGTRASRRVEEGLSRSFSGGGGKHSFPSPSAGDLTLDWEGKIKEFIVTTELEKDGTPKKDKEGNIKTKCVEFS